MKSVRACVPCLAFTCVSCLAFTCVPRLASTCHNALLGPALFAMLLPALFSICLHIRLVLCVSSAYGTLFGGLVALTVFPALSIPAFFLLPRLRCAPLPLLFGFQGLFALRLSQPKRNGHNDTARSQQRALKRSILLRYRNVPFPPSSSERVGQLSPDALQSMPYHGSAARNPWHCWRHSASSARQSARRPWQLA